MSPGIPVDLLALGAHPDDIEIHAAGSIALLTAAGRTVVMVDATRGECSSNGTPEQRLAEGRAAADILGVEHRLNLEFPDTGLIREHVALTETLVSLLRQWQPATILAPALDARHPDHRALAQCARDALFFSGLPKFMPHSPSVSRARLLHYHEHETTRPDFLIDVSNAWAMKMQALQCHASQFIAQAGSVPTRLNSGYLDILAHRARHWGATIGVDYAECFTSDRPVQLVGLLG